uniref:Fibronectin type-III domain-containing protein n=1 Tax=uncultured Planctomycetota bacterium TaxID=120965 RepID=A0A5B8KBX4_9BACT|nr:hypothetical protein fos2004AM_00019 [uncultured Planctomycetota bacterium]
MHSRCFWSGVTCLLLCCSGIASASVEYKSVADLTVEAQQIVIGDVVQVASFWNDDHTLIKSRIVVAPDQYLVGEGRASVEVLEMSGGTVGDLTLNVSVLPVFEPGDHVLLFLGDSEIRLVQSFQGAYLTDGDQIVRMSPSCGRIIPDSLQPLTEFLDEIQAALPPGTELPEVLPYEGGFELPLNGPRYALCGRDWTYKFNPMGEDIKVNPNCSDSSAGDSNSQITQIQNGMTPWTSAGAAFEFTYGGTTSQTYVSYNGTNLMYFDTTPPDGGSYVAANYGWSSSGDLLENDIIFNDRDYVWWNGDGGCSSMMDIWNISTHELGHSLCLLDLYSGGDSNKTMYGYVSYCETKKRSLHSDDINGIIAIYGTGGGPGDTTPPTPNPMYFEILPYAASETSISMRATLATDSESPPVEYWFNFLTGGSGGTDSSWQSSQDYTDYGLAVNTSYTYRVSARDSSANQNETNPSVNRSIYTLANVPASPILSNETDSSLDLNVQPNGNPSNTLFAVQCSSTVDPAWNGQYVDASGNPSASEVWQSDTSWGTTTVVDLLPGTEYCFHVKARNANQIETAFSSQSCASTSSPSDTTPPTPDPMSFSTLPYAVSATSISMTATLATDADSPPVQYEFDFVSGGTGGTDSGWQSPRDYTDDGLQPNTSYSYRVRARDSAPSPNETDWSTTASVYTLGNVPGAPILSNETESSLDLDVQPNGNPADTQFAVQCSSTVDPTWNGQYVNASGNPTGSAVWQTDSVWGTITVLGLEAETQYCFHVKARNGDLIETAFSSQSCTDTLPQQWNLGDMNCDGTLSFLDIDPFVLALDSKENYEAEYPECNYYNADCNEDGTVSFLDIDPFIDLLDQ